MSKTDSSQRPISNSSKKIEPKKDSTEIKKSRKKTSLKEFTFTKQMRPEMVAGFKMWLKGEYFHFDSEWEDLFEKYKNR